MGAPIAQRRRTSIFIEEENDVFTHESKRLGADRER